MTTRYPFTLIKEKLAAKDGKAIDFAVGKRPLTLPANIEIWVLANAGLALKSATRAEVDEFSAAAAALLSREYQVDVAPANILAAPGGRAAMSAFVACTLDPADTVYVTEPGYPAFARLAAHRHARIHEVQLDPARAFVPNVGETPGHDLKSPRVFALNYPNNPTGATLDIETLKMIAKAADANTIVFNDATYAPLVYGQPPVSLLGDAVPEMTSLERVELHSFSKLFPLGPIALSFLAGSDKSMREISTYSEFAWSPPSKLQLQATTMCLRDLQRMRELREYFPQQIEGLRQVLHDIGFEPYAVSAGVYLICKVPSSIAGIRVASAADAAARLMDEFDLAVVPFATAQHGYLRFSSMYLDDDLERLAALRMQLDLS